MTDTRTFPKGGLHPRSLGMNTLEVPIRNAHLPHFLYIPMSQHIGTPAKPVVAVGDTVKSGDLLGKASGFVSVNIHCPLPGTVTEIKKMPTAVSPAVDTVVVEVEGYFNMQSASKQQKSWRACSPKELTITLQEMGIVGMGGATFPTHVKYSVPEGKTIDTLVINAVECEPYLSADYRVVMERGKEVMEGIDICRHILGLKKAIIGIEVDTPAAISLLSDLATGFESIEVMGLEVKYPQGAEKQLIKATLNREVPGGGLPMDIGVVVSNVGTVAAIYDAVVSGLPLTERVTTVTGNILEKPGNYKVKIGTPIKDLLEEVGLKEEPGKLILGGPMMGLCQYTDEVPVTKGTSAILVLSRKETRRYPHRPCVRCGKCIPVCPMGLNPARIVKLIELGLDQDALDAGTMDCIECGCCSYSCPSGRHLAQGIKLGKLHFQARRKESTGG